MSNGKLKIVEVNKSDSADIDGFLSIAGSSKDTFRYFDSRPLSCIEYHIRTILAYLGEDAVGYAHLDKDGSTIWLGIAVAEEFRGRGIGKLLMNDLIEYARLNHIKEIKLSVDRANTNAIGMYKSYGFKILEEKRDIQFMILIV